MSEDLIHEAFAAMIRRRAIYKALRLTPGHVKVLRHQVKCGRPISLQKKVKLLKRSGWTAEAYRWRDEDLASLATFILKQGVDARSLGAAYLLEKWMKR
jgi:hypothetical protein